MQSRAAERWWFCPFPAVPRRRWNAGGLARPCGRWALRAQGDDPGPRPPQVPSDANGPPAVAARLPPVLRLRTDRTWEKSIEAAPASLDAQAASPLHSGVRRGKHAYAVGRLAAAFDVSGGLYGHRCDQAA